jgi:transcriptional regulator with XRE-family HTH domain
MTQVSPIGSSIAKDRARRARNPKYRAEQTRIAAFEQIARLVIKWRGARGLSQEALARSVGTSATAISRIESGQHKPNVDTLRRIARAMGLQLVIGFTPLSKTGTPKRARRTLSDRRRSTAALLT